MPSQITDLQDEDIRTVWPERTASAQADDDATDEGPMPDDADGTDADDDASDTDEDGTDA